MKRSGNDESRMYVHWRNFRAIQTSHTTYTQQHTSYMLLSSIVIIVNVLFCANGGADKAKDSQGPCNHVKKPLKQNAAAVSDGGCYECGGTRTYITLSFDQGMACRCDAFDHIEVALTKTVAWLRQRVFESRSATSSSHVRSSEKNGPVIPGRTWKISAANPRPPSFTLPFKGRPT